jgi:hypothetical protein
VRMEARRKDVGFGGSENWAATSSLDNLGLLMEVVRRLPFYTWAEC